MKSLSIIAVLLLGLVGPALAQDASLNTQSGSGTSTQLGSTGAFATSNAAVAAQSQQNQQSQSQSQLSVYSNYSSSPSVNITTGAPIVNAAGAGATTSTTNMSNSPTVNIANNSPPVVLQNDSPAVTLNFPDQPTIYPGFAMNPPAELPFMRHYDVNRAWNTCPSLFDMSLEWDYSQVGAFDKHVAVDGKAFDKAQGSYSNIRVFVTKDEAMKAAAPKANGDGTVEKKIRYLFAGSAHGDVEGVSILDCEMAALAKARDLGANGMIIKIEGFTVASKTKGKSLGIGASGTWLERFGNMAVGLPVNFAYATALGDGYAKPFVCFYVVEVIGK
ncbi:MAG: hypothetical protein ABSE25_01035 [Syntrophorhabdales bacterium]|jgi:hypothetical protein